MIIKTRNSVFDCVLHFLRPLPTAFRVVYFWYSLALVISRTIAVSLSLASINDESKKSINILRAVPSQSWNIETERFLNDVNNDDIALSGMKFFFITRKLLLTVSLIDNLVNLHKWPTFLLFEVAGTIVTYELVLMQLNLNYKEISSCEP